MEKEKASDILKKEYPTIYNGYKQIMETQFELFASKMSDYGLDNISMGSHLEKPEDVKFSLTAVWIRMGDKMNRLKNLVIKNKSSLVKTESIKDTYQDIANYAIISQLVNEGKWKK